MAITPLGFAANEQFLVPYEFNPTSENSIFLKNEFGIRYGNPSEQQILPINTMELYWQSFLPRIGNSILYPAIETSVAKLIVNDLHGVIWGVGIGYRVPISNHSNQYKLSFDSSTKVNYLTRHDFGRKRYGGPIQFSYRIGVNLKILSNSNFSYSWQHMSNAERYEYNPALETHTFSMAINF